MIMLQYHDLKKTLHGLAIARSEPTIVHVSATLIPLVKGGAQTILGAILGAIDNILMPSFTFKTMLIPEVGPADNLLEYGSGRIENLNAAIFTPDLPADFEDRDISEVFRLYPDVQRSDHPILSFLGLGLDAALRAQTNLQPYGHIHYLLGKNAKVLLFGKDPSALFCIHYCEQESGRKQFVRWALTEEGIKECPHYPGCSQGFHKILYYLGDNVWHTSIANLPCYAFSLDALTQTTFQLLKKDPYALLCNDLHCEKCNQIRKYMRQRRYDDRLQHTMT